MRGITWLAANQLASQEGLCTMEQASKLVILNRWSRIAEMAFNVDIKFVPAWRLKPEY